MTALTDAPPHVLFTRGRPERLGRLAEWCEANGIAPTLAEIEAERDRRRALETHRKEER